jgi:hypothetical protein
MTETFTGTTAPIEIDPDNELLELVRIAEALGLGTVEVEPEVVESKSNIANLFTKEAEEVWDCGAGLRSTTITEARVTQDLWNRGGRK